MSIETTESDLFKKHGITHGFTHRIGGVSKPPFDSLNMKKSRLVDDDIENVASNIELFGLAPKRAANGVFLQLEGGDNVVTVNKCSGYRTLYANDGVVTNQRDCLLAITVADCLPILLADVKASVVGIAHAGWKGSAGRITTKVVERMVQVGAKVDNMSAVIGPGICGRCYEVELEVAGRFDSRFSIKKGENKYLLDLIATNLAELESAGVTDIDVVRTCTFENTDKFYSARKDKITGRFLAYISN